MTLYAILATAKPHFLCTIRKALWDGTHIFSCVNGKCMHHQLCKWRSWSFIEFCDVIKTCDVMLTHGNYVAAFWFNMYMYFTAHSHKTPRKISQLNSCPLTVARIAYPPSPQQNWSGTEKYVLADRPTNLHIMELVLNFEKCYQYSFVSDAFYGDKCCLQ
jgi:hypothetical protein